MVSPFFSSGIDLESKRSKMAHGHGKLVDGLRDVNREEASSEWGRSFDLKKVTAVLDQESIPATKSLNIDESKAAFFE